MLLSWTSRIRIDAPRSTHDTHAVGFFANAAKVAANPEIWNAPDKFVAAYKDMEKMVASRAAECGASYTTIRAGTLKGGGSGDVDSGSGEPTFLDNTFYSLGQQVRLAWQLGA